MDELFEFINNLKLLSEEPKEIARKAFERGKQNGARLVYIEVGPKIEGLERQIKDLTSLSARNSFLEKENVRLLNENKKVESLNKQMTNKIKYYKNQSAR